MRTTLNLDDDALALVQAYAKVRCWPLGKAVSELIRHASAPPVGLKKLALLRSSFAPSPLLGFTNARAPISPDEPCINRLTRRRLDPTTTSTR